TINDLYTDLQGYIESTEENGYHSGMYTSASFILLDLLKKTSIIKKEYSIKVIGHSLGAGMSAILVIQLKLLLQNHNIHAWNFATPPCCTLQSAQNYEKLITNFVNEENIVPRLSLENLYYFKNLYLFLKDKKNEKPEPKDDKNLFIPGTIYYIYKNDKIIKCGITKAEYLYEITPQQNLLEHNPR
ncbi:19786_t:CDS:2, partial [Gigaspora margarita]